MDGVWRGVAPFAAGEVGDVDAEGAAGDGLLAEDAREAPQGAVVNVHVQREALVEAADQTEHHHEIHAAVPLLVVGGEGLEFGPEWVGVAVAHLGGLGLVEPAVAPRGAVVHIEARRVAVVGGLGADDLVQAAVGAAAVGVELQHDALATGGSNEGGVHVAALDALGHVLEGAFVGGGQGLTERGLLGAHAHQVAQGIAAQDVKVHRHRAKAVGGVEVAVAVQVVLQAPAVFVVGGVEHHHAQVVQVGALGVGEGAKDALFDHLHDPQLLAVVAAVLQHDAMAAGLLGGLDQVNGFLVGRGDGHLAGGMQALAHGMNGHGGVPFPRGADQGHVGDFGVACRFPCAVASCEDLRCVLLELANAGLGLVDFLRVDVADRGDFGVAFADEPFEHVDEARTAVAEPNEGNAHLGDAVGGQVKYRTLEVGLGHAVLENGIEVVVGRLPLESAGGHESAQAEESAPQKFPSLHGPKLGCGTQFKAANR